MNKMPGNNWAFLSDCKTLHVAQNYSFLPRYFHYIAFALHVSCILKYSKSTKNSQHILIFLFPKIVSNFILSEY